MKRKIIGIFLSITLVFGSTDFTVLAAESVIEEDALQEKPVTGEIPIKDEASVEEISDIIEISDEMDISVVQPLEEIYTESDVEETYETRQTDTKESSENIFTESETEKIQTDIIIQAEEQETEETKEISGEEETTEENQDVTSSGSCGPNLNWSFDEDTQTLTISGTGEMSYTGNAPWSGWAWSAEKLVLEDGITSIHNGAFSGFMFLTGDLVIPDSVKTIGSSAFYECTRLDGNLTIGSSVTEIGSSAFYECLKLTGDLVIPDNVKTIGSSAFQKCSGLNGNLTIGSSVTEIDSYAFGECSGLSGNLVIPNNVTTMGDKVFDKCSGFNGDFIIGNGLAKIKNSAFTGLSGLKGKLVIGSGVTEIGNSAFTGLSGLSGDLVIPDSVITIGSSAFYKCGFDGNLTIGNSVTEIGNSAFLGCSGLKGNLVIPDSIAAIGDKAFDECSGFNGDLIIGNGVTEIKKAQFSSLTGLKGKLIIGSGVTEIGEKAFWGLSGLSGNLVIPDKVVTIGSGAFSGCSGLSGNLVIPDKVVTIGSSAFSGCSGLSGNLVIPDKVVTIDSGVFSGCSGLSGNLIIPNNVTTIGKGAFSGCSGLNGNLTIGSSVTEIGENAFYNCSGLTRDLIIPDSVETIGGRAFYECSGLNGNLTIGSSITKIGENAFYNCSGLTGALVIPDSVKIIGERAFYGCSGLNGNLTIGSSVTEIGSYVFWGCSGLTGDLIIPDSVTTIGDKVFYGCNGFNGGLTIGNGMTEIGSSAFTGLSGLKGKLTIGKSITKIGYSAFSGCSGLTGDLIIPDSVTEISDSAFSGCSGLDGMLKIPENLETISSGIFEGCNRLSGALVIPSGVKSIEYNAFSGCSGLTGNLVIPDGITEVGSSAFSGCSGLTGNLVIPDGVTKIDSSAFSECRGLTGDLIIRSSVAEIGDSAFTGCAGLGDVYIQSYKTKISAGSFDAFRFKEEAKTKIYAPMYSDAWMYAADNSDFYEYSDWGEHKVKDVTADFSGWEVVVHSGLYEYTPGATVYAYIYAYDKDDQFLGASPANEITVPANGIIDISLKPIKWDELFEDAAFVRAVIKTNFHSASESTDCAASERIKRENCPEISFRLNEVYSLSKGLMIDVTMLGDLIFLDDENSSKSQRFRFEVSCGQQEDKNSWASLSSGYEYFSNSSKHGTIQITGIDSDTTYYGELRIYAGDSENPIYEQIFDLSKFTTATDEIINMQSAFPDKVFRDLVQKQLSYYVEDKENVALSELEKINSLSSYVKGFDVEVIQSIQGIEYLLGLNSISLTNHEISDADQVDWSELKALEQINLKGNEIKSAPDLSDNINLTQVNFEENYMPIDEVEKLLETIPENATVQLSSYTQRPDGLKLITEPVYYDDEIIVRVHGYKTDLPYSLQFYLDGQQVTFTDGWSGLWRASDSKLAMGKHTIKVELLKKGIVEDSRQNTFEIKEEDYYTKRDKIYFSSKESYNGYDIDDLFYSEKITASVTGIDIVNKDGNTIASSQYASSYKTFETRYSTILEDGFGIRKYINCAQGRLQTEDKSSIPAGEYDVVLKFSDFTQHTYENLVIVVEDDLPVISGLEMAGSYDNSGDYTYLNLYTPSVNPEKLLYVYKLGKRELETKYISHKETYNGVVVKIQKVNWIDSSRVNYQNVEVSVMGSDEYPIIGGSPQILQVSNGQHYVAYNEVTGKMEVSFSADCAYIYPVGKKVKIPLRKLQNGTYVDTDIICSAIVRKGITKFDLADSEGNPAKLEIGVTYSPKLQGTWNSFTVKGEENVIRNKVSIKGIQDFPAFIKVYRRNDTQCIVQRTIQDSGSIKDNDYYFTKAFVEYLDQDGIYEVVVSDGKNRYLRSTYECILRVGDETTDDSSMLEIHPEDLNPDNPGHQHDYAQSWSNDEHKHWHECSCGAKKDESAHTESDWITEKEATETETGKQHTECTVCGRLMHEQEIPILEPGHQHNYAQDWFSDGEKHWHECSCGAKKDESAHTESDWITDKEATETENGRRHTECVICKKVLREKEISFDGKPVPDASIKISEIPAQQYTGSELAPEVIVTDGEKVLREGIDYQIAYINTKDAYLAGNSAYAGKASPKVKVTMLGEYKGIYTKNFDINPVSIADESAVCIFVRSTVESSKSQKQKPDVYFNGIIMREGKDYKALYPSEGDYRSAASWKVTIKAISGGNFVDERTVTYEIISKSDSNKEKFLMSAASIKLSGTKFIYTGLPYEPAVTVKYGKEVLKADNYDVSYCQNINAGTATVIVTGKGRYVGTQKIQFKIETASIKDAAIEGISDTTYQGENVVFDNLVVKAHNQRLVKGKDFIVAYKNNLKAGTATVIVTGKGNYSGSQSTKFKINAAVLNERNAVTSQKAQYSPKGAILSDLKIVLNGKILTQGKDYKVTYKNNKKITSGQKSAEAVIKGVNGCTGSFKLNYEIEPADFSSVTITADNVVYKDKAGNYKAKIKVYDASGKQLAEKKQYTIESYHKVDGSLIDNNYKAEVGEYITVKIVSKEGDENYKNGTSAVYTYKIVKGLMSKAKISSLPSKGLSKDDVTELSAEDLLGKVKLNGDILVYGKDFEIVEESFINTDRKGKASVMLIGKNEYSGTKIVKYTIKK